MISNDVGNVNSSERMSFLKQLALTGTTIGLSLGTVLNFMNSGSMFHVDQEQCKNAFEGWNVLKSIHDHREISLREFNLDIMRPLLFNSFLPLSYIIPMVAFVAWNVVADQDRVELKIKEFTKKQIVLVSKCLIDPFVQNIAFMMGGCFLLQKLKYSIRQETGINLSGHIVAQSALAIYMANSRSVMSNRATSIQLKLYSGIASVIFISDAVWAYNTARNCHSVGDVTATVAIVGLLYLGVQAGRMVIIKVINYAVSKLLQKTKTA